MTIHKPIFETKDFQIWYDPGDSSVGLSDGCYVLKKDEDGDWDEPEEGVDLTPLVEAMAGYIMSLEEKSNFYEYKLKKANLLNKIEEEDYWAY